MASLTASITFSVAVIQFTVIGHVVAGESLPSIQAIYDSTRAKSAPQAQTVAISARLRVDRPASLAVEWPTEYAKEVFQKPAPVRPAVTKSPVVAVKPRSPAEVKMVAAKPATESLHNSVTAKKLDISKLSIFGPQSSSYRYDARMISAMEIASARASSHSRGSCWRYVKNALLSAGLVDSRPTSAYAKEAADELTNKFGFRRVSCSDPYQAPVGSVLVYGGGGAGHVEFRSRSGFVSDFTAATPSRRPLIGVYVK